MILEQFSRFSENLVQNQAVKPFAMSRKDFFLYIVQYYWHVNSSIETVPINQSDKLGHTLYKTST